MVHVAKTGTCSGNERRAGRSHRPCKAESGEPMTPSLIPDTVKVLTVGELNRQVKALVEDGFPTVWVSGEISNLARPASGHIYLSLKDAEGQIRAVLWRSQAMRVRFDLREGMEVI